MIKKILLILLLLPVICITLVVVTGLLAGVLGVATYYCVKYLLAGLAVLAIVLIVRKHQQVKN